jgi:8-oxo-dGTP pyrophosphatase MutT (NUDIX family)
MAEIVSNLVQVHPYRLDRDEPEYLLLKRSDAETHGAGIWQVVTGLIEPGERSEESARRETIEETGLVPLELVSLPDVVSFYFAALDQIVFSPLFAVRLASGVEPLLSEEHVAFEWLPRFEALERLVYPSHRDGLKLVDRLIAGRDSSSL